MLAYIISVGPFNAEILEPIELERLDGLWISEKSRNIGKVIFWIYLATLSHK